MRSPVRARVASRRPATVPARAGRLATGASLAAVAALAALATPARAYYEDAHLTADDARVTVDSSGVARVEHALVWRIVAGQPHSFDLVGTEPSAVPETTATLESDDGHTLPAIVTAVPGRGLRVTVGEPKSLRHGQSYHVKLAYTVNVAESGELTRDGLTYRLVMKAPVPLDGLEGPKVTFALPAALEAPAPFVGEGGMRDSGVTGTVKRDRDHDEVELVWPHVGRGEEGVWAVRVSARAFEAGRAASSTPPPPRRDEPAGPSPLAYGVVALLAMAFAGGVLTKARRLEAATREPMRALIPLRAGERAAVAGAALFVGVSLQLVDASYAGVAALVIAMVAAVVLPPRAARVPRGPGRWFVLRPDEAFPRGRSLDPFDGTCLAGAAVATTGVFAFLLAGHALRSTQPEAALLVPLDALVLVPLFATGLASQLPSARPRRGSRWLRRVFTRLHRIKTLRVSPWARVPTGLVEPDEVRVLVLPRDPMPGLSSIEVGLAWTATSTSVAASPEVLVRVQEASAASARMATLAEHVVPVPGRKPEERVYRLAPRVPTGRATAALVASLGGRLADRRVEALEWEHQERRVPPSERAPASMNAASPVPG